MTAGMTAAVAVVLVVAAVATVLAEAAVATGVAVAREVALVPGVAAGVVVVNEAVAA